MGQNSQPDYQPRIITCVYCGQAYPQDTPTWGDAILTEHIKVCKKHPMRKAEADIRKLRKALYGVLGASTKGDLVHKISSFEGRIKKDSECPVSEKFLYDEEIVVLKNHIEASQAMLDTMEYE